MYYVHVDARVSVRVLESARVVCACERAGCHMGARVVCACEHVSASEGATHVWFVWLILYQYYIPTTWFPRQQNSCALRFLELRFIDK